MYTENKGENENHKILQQKRYIITILLSVRDLRIAMRDKHLRKGFQK